MDDPGTNEGEALRRTRQLLNEAGLPGNGSSGDHQRPPGRHARARPSGRAQHAGSARRAGEKDYRLSHIRAAACGALIQ